MALVMTEVVRKVTKPVPVGNRSPEVQALSVTELFSYKPDYSHFDIRTGRVSFFFFASCPVTVLVLEDGYRYGGTDGESGVLGC